MSIDVNSNNINNQNIIYSLLETNQADAAGLAVLHTLSLSPENRPTWWNRADERIKILLSAAEHNITGIVRLLRDAPIGEEALCPLHAAVQSASAPTVQKLLRLGASLFSQNAHGQTALSLLKTTFAQNWMQLITDNENLIACTTNVQCCWDYLELLCENNKIAEATKLYEAIVALPDEQKPRNWECTTQHEEFFNLTAAAGAPCRAALDHCTSAGFQSGPQKKSYLMWALQLGLEIPLLQLIAPKNLTGACSLYTKDANGKSIAQYIVDDSDEATLKTLITDWNPERGVETHSLIIALLTAKKFSLLALLIKKYKPNINIDHETKTAELFCLAAANGYPTEAFERVYSSSTINVWYKDQNLRGPLSYAIALNRKDLILRFLEQGAPLTTKNNNGITVAQELVAKYGEPAAMGILDKLSASSLPHYIRCLFDIGKREKAVAFLTPIVQKQVPTPPCLQNIGIRTDLYITLLELNENELARKIKADGVNFNEFLPQGDTSHFDEQASKASVTRLFKAIHWQRDPQRVVLLLQEGAFVNNQCLHLIKQHFGQAFMQDMYHDWDITRPDTTLLMVCDSSACAIFLEKALHSSKLSEKASVFFEFIDALEYLDVVPYILQLLPHINAGLRNTRGNSVLKTVLAKTSLSITHPFLVTFFSPFGITKESLQRLEALAHQTKTTPGKALLNYIKNEFCKNSSTPARAGKILHFLLNPLPKNAIEETAYFAAVATDQDLSLEEKQQLLSIELTQLNRLYQFPNHNKKNILMLAAEHHLGSTILNNLLSKEKENQLAQYDATGHSGTYFLLQYAKADFDNSFFSQWYSTCSLQSISQEVVSLVQHGVTSCASVLIQRLNTLNASEAPSTWNKETKTKVFYYLLSAPSTTENRSFLQDLLPAIDQSYIHDNKCLLMHAAKNKLDKDLFTQLDLSIERLTVIDDTGIPAFVYILDHVKTYFSDDFFTHLIDELSFNPDIPKTISSLYTHGYRDLGQRLLHRLMTWTPPFGRGAWWNKDAKTLVFFAITANMQKQGSQTSHSSDLTLLAPEINPDATNDSKHTPLFSALVTADENLLSLLITKGASLAAICEGHSLFYHLFHTIGEAFALATLSTSSIQNRPDLCELVPYLIQDGFSELANTVQTKILTEGTAAQKTLLFFAFSRSECAGKTETLQSLLPFLDYTQKDTTHEGQLVLMRALSNKLPHTVISTLLERDFAGQIIEKDTTGKSTLQYLIDYAHTAQNNGVDESTFINRYPLDHERVVEELCALFEKKYIRQAHQLLTRLLELPEEQIPAWWNAKAKTAVFFKEAAAMKMLQNGTTDQIALYCHDLLVLACDLEPEALNNALFFALHNKHRALAYSLIMQGAGLFSSLNNKIAFDLLLQNFGEEQTAEILDAISFEQPTNVIRLIPVLIYYGHLQKAQTLYKRFDNLHAKPSWWNTTKKTQFFFSLTRKLPVTQVAIDIITDLITLHPSLDLSAQDQKQEQRTVLHAAAQYKLPANIMALLLEKSTDSQLLAINEKNETALQLILQHSTIDPCHPTLLKFFKRFSFSETDLSTVVAAAEHPEENEEGEALPQAAPGQALLNYIAEHDQLLSMLLQPAAQKTRSTNTELFFLIAASCLSPGEKEALFSQIIHFLDVTKKDRRSPHRTVLHAIAKYQLGIEYTDTLLSTEEQFFAQNDTGMTAFAALISCNAIRMNNPILQRFLKALDIPFMRTTQELWEYLRSETGFWRTSGTVASKLAVAFLITDRKKFSTLCTICAKNPQIRGEVLQDLNLFGGYVIETQLLDNSLTLNKAHLVLPAPVKIPNKSADTQIANIRQLYEKYSDESAERKAKNIKSLQVFEDRFTQRAFFGGPAKETALYANIDNASCNVVAYFRKGISAIEQENPHKTIEELSTEGNQKAKALLSDMRIWFQDCIAASELCAPRIYNNAVTNYLKYVLRKKTDTFKDMLYDILAEKRAEAISGLFDEKQSVHAANQFLYAYARKFAIPGYEIYEAIVDPWRDSHEDQVNAAKSSFEQMYPHLAVDALRDTLIGSRDLYEKFLFYLKEKAPEDAETQAKNLFIKNLTSIWYGAKNGIERQEKITQYLLRHSLIINDTTTLQSMKEELNTMVDEAGKTLYIASVQELGRDNKMHFTIGTILSALIDLKVLS